MRIDLTKLRSARVIRDREKIEAVLKRRGAGVTFEDDGPVIRAATAIRARAAGDEGMPKVSDSKLAELAENVGVTWEDGFEERVVRYWGSDERVDSYGDIVRQNWRFDRFEDNPIMPFSHNWWDNPVGVALDWGVVDRKSKGYDGPALWLLGLFATAELNQEAESVLRLVKSGFLRGGSVGFSAGKIIEVEDRDERAKLGLGPWGVILDDNMLLEFSPTPIPANSGAMAVLASARRSRLLEPNDIQTVRELYRRNIYRTRGDRDEWSRVEDLVLATASRLFPDERFESHRELGVPMSKKQRGKKRTTVRGTTTTKGAALAGLLNELIDEMADDETSRDDIIESMGEAAGISSETVTQILDEEIDCPPLERLEGFAEALDVSVDDLVAAAEEDGCEYETEDGEDGEGDDTVEESARSGGCRCARRRLDAIEDAVTAIADAVTAIAASQDASLAQLRREVRDIRDLIEELRDDITTRAATEPDSDTFDERLDAILASAAQEQD